MMRIKIFILKTLQPIRKISTNIYLLVFVAALIILFFSRFFFVIKHINIQGIDNLNGITQYSQKSYFFISPKEIEQNLYSLNPNIKSIKVETKSPDTIDIVVVKNRVTAKLAIADGELLLSNDGRIIAKQREKTLVHSVPIINYYQKLYFNQYRAGEVIQHKDIVYSLQFADGINEVGIKVEGIDIMNENMIVLRARESQYIFTTNRDMKAQVAEIKFIIEQLVIKGTNDKSIDVRFEKPVIIY